MSTTWSARACGTEPPCAARFRAGSSAPSHFDRRIDWSEFTVVTAADIPGENHIQLIVADQPCLADGKVNHCEEPIVLLAHPDKHKLREAVGAVQIEYDPLPPVFTIEESERQDVRSSGAPTICSRASCSKRATSIPRGPAPRTSSKVNTAPARRSISTLRTTASSPNTVRKTASRCGARCNARITFSKSLKRVFDLPEDKVRVIQTETGGAFGGKEDYPSMLACHAALLAMKCGHPVKMVYDRMEDLAATTKRHPSRVRHRTALDNDGKLLAMEIDLATDGGAYATLSSTVLSRATLHCSRTVCLPQCARSFARVGDQYRALRRISRLWRAAGDLRYGAAHGRNRRGSSASIRSSCGAGIFCMRATPTRPSS